AARRLCRRPRPQPARKSPALHHRARLGHLSQTGRRLLPDAGRLEGRFPLSVWRERAAPRGSAERGEGLNALTLTLPSPTRWAPPSPALRERGYIPLHDPRRTSAHLALSDRPDARLGHR